MTNASNDPLPVLYRVAHLEGRKRDKRDATLEGCKGAHNVVCQHARGIPRAKVASTVTRKFSPVLADKGIGIAYGNTALRDGVNNLSYGLGPILL